MSKNDKNIPQAVQDTVILELRQQDNIMNGNPVTNPNIQNGNFSANLKTPIIISEGDTVSVKSCFIDSAAENSGKIKVDESETNIITTQYLYFCMNNMEGKMINRQYQKRTDKGDINDTMKYILHKQISSLSQTEVVNYIDIQLGGGGNGMPLHWGEVNLNLAYTDELGQGQTHNVYIPQIIIGQDPGNDVFRFDSSNASLFPIKIKLDSTVTVAADQDKKLHRRGFRSIKDQNTTKNEVGTDNIFAPILFTSNATIQPGEYLPAELAKSITDALSVINPGKDYIKTPNDYFSQALPTSSGFFVNLQQCFTKCGVPDLPANPNDADHTARDNGFLFIREDGLKSINIPTTSLYPAGSAGNNDYTVLTNFCIGASEVGIEYDDILGKMVFAQLHSNILDHDVGVCCQAIESNTASTSGKFRYSGREGGILLKNLEPKSLWEKMGFLDPNTNHDLFVNCTEMPKIQQGTIANAVFTKIPNTDGVNATTNFCGIDTVYADTGGNKVIDLSAQPKLSSTIVTKIVATNPINQVAIENSYFIVEISGFEQTLNGAQQVMGGVQSIVSRFYNTDSITSAYNEGSIPYIHKGSPISLSHFNVRILAPDKEVVDNLGVRNTVYLEVIKSK